MNKVSPCSIRTLLKAFGVGFQKSVHCHSTYTYCHGATSVTNQHLHIRTCQLIRLSFVSMEQVNLVFYSPVASCCPIVSYYPPAFWFWGAVLDVSAVDLSSSPAVGFCPVGLTCATRHTTNRHRKPIRSHLCLSCCLFFLFFFQHIKSKQGYISHS